MPNLYLIYYSTDKNFVRPLINELQEKSFECHIATPELQKEASSLSQEIANVITNCTALLLFVSSKSFRLVHKRADLDLALQQKKKVISLSLDKFDWSQETNVYRLTGVQLINCMQHDWKSRLLIELEKAKVNSGVQNVIQKIENMDYRGSLSDTQMAKLRDLFTQVSYSKDVIKKIDLYKVSQTAIIEELSQISLTIAYLLVSLSDQHTKLKKTIIHSQAIEQEIRILDQLQTQALVVEKFIKQFLGLPEPNVYEYENAYLLSTTQKLRLLLHDQKIHSTSKDLTLEVSIQIERHFDDLIFYASKILLLLDELANITPKSRHQQP